MAEKILVLSPEFRLSYANLFVAQPNMNGIVRFEMEMLFPKSAGVEQFEALEGAYNAAIEAANFSGPGPAPRTFRQALIDGDTKAQAGRHGMFLLRANSGEDFPPSVLIQNRQPALPADVYPGCWCKAVLQPYSFEARKDGHGPVIGRGASFSMLTVWKQRDDEAFSKAASPEEIDAILDKADQPANAGEIDGLLR